MSTWLRNVPTLLIGDSYTLPEIVTEGILQEMIDRFDTSEYTTKDGWRVFADLAKMQPFQDGNKRTALIAANEAMGAFETQDFLVLPLQPESNTKFIGLLMRYYLTDDATQQDRLLDEMVSLTPVPLSKSRSGKQNATDSKVSRSSRPGVLNLSGVATKNSANAIWKTCRMIKIFNRTKSPSPMKFGERLYSIS